MDEQIISRSTVAPRLFFRVFDPAFILHVHKTRPAAQLVLMYYRHCVTIRSYIRVVYGRIRFRNQFWRGPRATL